MKGEWLEGIDFSGLGGDGGDTGGGQAEAQPSVAEKLAALARQHPDMTGFLTLMRWDTPEGYRVETARFRIEEEQAHYMLHRFALSLLMSAKRHEPPMGEGDAPEGGTE